MLGEPGITLLEELSAEVKLACIEVGLNVYRVGWPWFTANLWGKPGEAHLFVWSDAPDALVEWTAMQSLADLGVPGWEWVPIEPFGRFPWEHPNARLIEGES